MTTLTPKQSALYSEMIKKYDQSGLCKICSLDSFLNSQLERMAFIDRKKWADLYIVTEFAQTDY